MIIAGRDGLGEIAPHQLVDALRSRFPDAVIRLLDFRGKDNLVQYDIQLDPSGESGFTLTVLKTGGFSLDGLPDQNARAAVAIRDVLDPPDDIDGGWMPMSDITW